MHPKLKAIYDRIPEFNCLGLCYQTCGVIPMYPAEVAHLKSRGIELPAAGGNLTCSHLRWEMANQHPNGMPKCGIYDDRPYICRISGATENLRCEFGCTPLRILSQQEEFQLRQELERLKAGKVVTILKKRGD